MKLSKAILTIVFFLVFYQVTFACTGVFYHKNGQNFSARNMDWDNCRTLIYINAQNKVKKAVLLKDQSKPAEWTSKYGSVSFNLNFQLDPLFILFLTLQGLDTSSGPTCGLNEKGLWGGSFWVYAPPTVNYEIADKRPAINNWQVLEYLLDNSANVKDAIENLKKVRVAYFKLKKLEAKVHWFLADSQGNAAIIEFPNGKLKISYNPSPPVISNAFYEVNKKYLSQFQGFGGKKTLPKSTDEFNRETRFVLASAALNKVKQKDNVTASDLFAVLKTVWQTPDHHDQGDNDITLWTTVYDLNQKVVYWKSKSCEQVQSLKLQDIDFSKNKIIKMQ